jgi:hypothetical protein
MRVQHLNLESYLPSNPPPSFFSLFLVPVAIVTLLLPPVSRSYSHPLIHLISFLDKETKLQAICFLLL